MQLLLSFLTAVVGGCVSVLWCRGFVLESWNYIWTWSCDVIDVCILWRDRLRHLTAVLDEARMPTREAGGSAGTATPVGLVVPLGPKLQLQLKSQQSMNQLL